MGLVVTCLLKLKWKLDVYLCSWAMEANDIAVLLVFFYAYILSSRPEPEAVATKKQKLDVSMVLYIV